MSISYSDIHQARSWFGYRDGDPDDWVRCVGSFFFLRRHWRSAWRGAGNRSDVVKPTCPRRDDRTQSGTAGASGSHWCPGEAAALIGFTSVTQYRPSLSCSLTSTAVPSGGSAATFALRTV